MLLTYILRALPAACLINDALGTPLEHAKRQASIDDFIESQTAVSINGVLANIGPDGAKAPGASAGIVIASPSRFDPDYYYTWIRDAALAYKALIERFIAGDTTLRQKIDDYVSAQAHLQNVSNPSGGPDTGGLGEPKFQVNETAFTGSWGRPQRDGPPLRATALTIYANWLIGNDEKDHAQNTVWPVIAKDLAYTALYWNQTGFDLWEEINGSSFFTLSATHRALSEGSALAKTLGKDCVCTAASPQILCFLQSFWTGFYIDSNINVNDGRTGKDVNSIISSIHTFDPESNCTDTTFQPCSSRALANHKVVTDSFRAVYDINHGIAQGRAVAVGRYAEDVYYNGNPWYLATLAAAEQLYAAAYQWDNQGAVIIDAVSLPFFTDLIPNVTAGTYAKGTTMYWSVLSAVRNYGDDYMAIVQKYTPANGGLAEQFDKSSGTPLSAVDLTWSYAAFLTAAQRRAGLLVPSWDEASNNVPPTTCIATTACKTYFTFEVEAEGWNGDLFVVGQLAELGNWEPASAIPMHTRSRMSDGYSPFGHPSYTWYSDLIDLPTATEFEFKYIKKNSSGQVDWEKGPNRSLAIGGACDSNSSTWGLWHWNDCKLIPCV